MRLSVVIAACTALVSLPGFSSENQNSVSQEIRPASRLSVRHIEPKGIGYNQGYTTLELFVAPTTPWWNDWVPFLDLRGHLFDNGTNKAANAGLGVRYLDHSTGCVWGVNTYYDYHNTKYQYYNQIALGFECLGKIWDARLNGYLPVGNKKSGFFKTAFKAFSGHSMILSREYEFAMKGINAEAGVHVDHFKHVPLYFAGGPYYLYGRGRAAFGGEIRAVADLFDVVRLEGNASYDHIFKWIGQGQIGFTFALGRKEKLCRESVCSSTRVLTERSAQRVDRFEIIPIKDPAKQTLAINPATDQPYVFWFVNNTSTNSQGTFNAPFTTLAAAQNASASNQEIYVFPGDGLTTGMDAGITLQNSQMLLGASIVHPISTTLGTISIPPFASTPPNITNLGGDLVTLANNNTISGCNFTVVAVSTNHITGTGISNLSVSQNTFTTSNANSFWMLLTNCSGSVLVENNIYNGIASRGISLSGTNETMSLVGNSFFNGTVTNNGIINILNSQNNLFLGSGIPIRNNGTIVNLISAFDSFSNIVTSYGIYNQGTVANWVVSDDVFNAFTNSSNIYNIGTVGSLSVTNTIFSNFTNASCIQNNGGAGGTIATGTISGCSFYNFDSTSLGVFIGNPSNPTSSWTITNNTFNPSNPTTSSINIALTAQVMCLEMTGNSAPGSAAYVFSATAPGELNRTSGSDSSTNTGGFAISGAVSAPGSCSLP